MPLVVACGTSVESPQPATVTQRQTTGCAQRGDPDRIDSGQLRRDPKRKEVSKQVSFLALGHWRVIAGHRRRRRQLSEHE